MNPIRMLPVPLVLATLVAMPTPLSAQAAILRKDQAAVRQEQERLGQDKLKAQDRTAPAPAARVIMGVTMGNPDEGLAAQLEVDPDQVVYVFEVMPGFGAHKAGIRRHDVITHLDGKSPLDTERVREMLARKKPGDKVAVRLLRGKEVKELEVELMAPGAAPRSEAPVAVTSPEGVRVRELDTARKQLAEMRQDLQKKAAEMSREYARLAEEVARTARGKAQEFGDPKQAEELRVKIDGMVKELTRDLEKRVQPELEKSLRNLDKLIEQQVQRAIRPGLYALNEGKDQVLYVPQLGQSGGLWTSSRPSGGTSFGWAPTPAIDTKQLNKVEGRLGAIEERLARIEKMLEKAAKRDN